MGLLHPPRPRLTLDVGITGHRAKLLSPELVALAAPQVEQLLEHLRLALRALHADDGGALFADDPPQLRLHTALATGADQLAASLARAQGYRVRAILPLAPDAYGEDFETGPERLEFTRQLNCADEIFALDSDPADRDRAYVAVGKAVVAASDILVAVWDGGPAAGPGGTAHVVELALAASVPVIHVPVDREQGIVGPPRLLSGCTLSDLTAAPLASPEEWSDLVRTVLTPAAVADRRNAACFFAERERITSWRLEHPLLVSLLGVKPLPPRPWRQASVASEITVRQVDGDPPISAFSYAWANFLAVHYAQLFRSGHVTNYLLSALAVVLALSGLLFPAAKIVLVLAELGIIALLFANTRAGTRGEWHRKWLQYRYLAETLRPLTYCKLTGLVGPPFRSGSGCDPLHRQGRPDWTRWYAAAVWREMAWPSGTQTPATVRELAERMTAEQLLPQASYHLANAERMTKLDHQLHRIGNLLMGGVIASCLLYLLGYLLLPDRTTALTHAIVVLTAGLPAIGAAVFGLRGHGEHLLAASRSAQTAAALTASAERLRRASRSDQLAVELEISAAIMLSDLNEWNATYRERSLKIPA